MALLSVAAGAKDITTGVGFAGYTYMQDVDKTKCDSDSIPIGTEGRLIDKRDGKIYWVAKLKDNLCWMTQNLDYDGYGVPSDIFNEDNVNTAIYYDTREYVYTQPTITTGCTIQLNGSLSECMADGWVNVSNMTSATESNLSEIIAYDSTLGYIYNAHYLSGNRYNWFTATAGSGLSVSDGENAPDSICPVGWSLPTSNNDNLGSFGYLLNGYTYGAEIAVAPYYYLYGGHIDGTTLSLIGTHGIYWSATARNDNDAYYMVLNDGGIASSYYLNARYLGYSVRCVAR